MRHTRLSIFIGGVCAAVTGLTATAFAQQGSLNPAKGPVEVTSTNGKDPTAPYRACLPGTGKPDYESRTLNFSSRSGKAMSVFEIGVDSAGPWSGHTVRNSEKRRIPIDGRTKAWGIIRFVPQKEGPVSGRELFMARPPSGGDVAYNLKFTGVGYNCEETDGVLPPVDRFAEDSGEGGSREDAVGEQGLKEGLPGCDKEKCEPSPPPGEDEQQAPSGDSEEGDRFPPLEDTPGRPTGGLGLSGMLEGPCPDGVKTLAIILQFDDANGFEELARRLREGYRGVEKTPSGRAQRMDVEVQHLRPVVGDMRKKGSRAFNSDVFIARLKAILASVDCTCTDVVITVLGHGKADSKGENHEIVYKDRYTSGGNPYMRKTDLKWSDILADIMTAAKAADKDCARLNFALTECYAGAAIGDVEKTVAKFSPPRAKGSVSVFAGSAKRQVCNGRIYEQNGETVVDVYFVDAITQCLKIYGSMDRAWRCIAQTTADGARQGVGRAQNPQRLPPPVRR